MNRPFSDLVCSAEQIANNHTLPARITDWADAIYEAMNSRGPNASVLIEDLELLQAYGEDQGHGINRIDYALARRGQ